MKSYPILRSGFISLNKTGLKQPVDSDMNFAAAILNKRHLEPNNDYFYHEVIQNLFLKMKAEAQSNVLNQLVVQEQVLLAAYEAFGTKNFWDWVIFQITNAELTSLHTAFLIETLNYISGAPRKTHVEQWIRLLNADKDKSAIVTIGSVNHLTLSDLFKNKMVPSKINKVFVKWLRQPQGFYDFLCSLEVIFGNRRLLKKTT